MIGRWMIQSSDSLWRKLGEEAAKTAVSTFVEEGIKASIELWKTRHMKELDIEFEERRMAREEESSTASEAEEEERSEEASDDEDAQSFRTI